MDVTQIHSPAYAFQPVLSEYTVNTIWPPLVPFKAAQLTHVVNLRKPLARGSFNHATITCANAQSGAQRQLFTSKADTKTCQRTGTWAKHSGLSTAIRKFQSAINTCTERMEDEWAKDSSVNECGFRPVYRMTQILDGHLGRTA